MLFLNNLPSCFARTKVIKPCLQEPICHSACAFGACIRIWYLSHHAGLGLLLLRLAGGPPALGRQIDGA